MTLQNQSAASQATRQVIGVRARRVSGQPYSEAGIGSLMPWNNSLWFSNYPDVTGDGVGEGLYRLDPGSMTPTFVAEHNGTHAARIISADRMFIGQHVVDLNGTVASITGQIITDHERITAYAKLPNSPYVWALTMNGVIYQIATSAPYASTRVADATTSGNLNLTGFKHGKGLWGHPDGIHLIMAFNMEAPDGALAWMNTSNNTFGHIDAGRNSWIEVSGCYEGNQHIFATGHDGLAALLYHFDGTTWNATPHRYRIPMPTDQYKYGWQQEWMRIRAVETERYLMDLHGQFFQLSTWVSGDNTFTNGLPRVEPIARHLRTIPDFCFWNGYFVMSGNQTTPQALNIFPNVGGQAESGLLFTTLDDVWSYGKPSGTGFWYRNASVTGGAQSDYMLMRGYNDRQLHLFNNTSTSVDVDVRIRMGEMPADFTYTTLTVPANSYAGAYLPAGDWCAVRPVQSCADLTAWVVYT